MTMKLQQGQVWKQGREYIRIVRLERIEVEYKSMTSLHTKDARKLVTSKRFLPAAETGPIAGTRQNSARVSYFNRQVMRALSRS
jgi:hypothetical protein